MDKSFKIAFIGVGQGGCNIANTFRRMGYEDVVFINTASVDLDGLEAPDRTKFLIGDHSDGAGKDAAEGKRAAEVSIGDIESRISSLLDEGRVEKVFVCIGSGGGTGSGAGPVVIDAAQRAGARVGVIATLPMSRELVSDKVKDNSRGLLDYLCDECDAGSLYPLMVLDNQLIKDVAPTRSFRTMWNDGNSYGCEILHIFNTLSSTPTFLNSVDKNDLRGVFDRPGTMFMGRSENRHVLDKSSTSRSVRASFNRGIFLHSDSPVDQSDCACVMTLPPSVLDMSAHAFDLIVDSINEVIDDVPGGNIHRGLYEDAEARATKIYTITIGDKSPRSAIAKRLT